MSNPAFIVDGFTEKLIIQHICPNQPIRRTDLNGKDASINAISKRISSLIRLLGGRYYPIVILIDKEERDIDFINIACEIKSILNKEGLQNCDIRIGVADRMIENWIIADWKSLTSKAKNISKTDTVNGASIIRKVHGSYDKTTDGVNLFLKCNQAIMYENSESYKYFIDQLEGIDCEYLNFKRNK